MIGKIDCIGGFEVIFLSMLGASLEEGDEGVRVADPLFKELDEVEVGEIFVLVDEDADVLGDGCHFGVCGDEF